MKKYILFLIYYAIILSGVCYPAAGVYCSVKGNFNSHLFRALETAHISGEIFLLSNVRCAIENASRPLGDPASMKAVWKNLKVDSGAVEDVYLIVEPMDQIRALRDICTHNCLWFEFKQDSPAASEDGYKTYGIVCSGQLTFKNDRQYFLFQFCSKEDYFKLAYCMDSTIYMYKLNLSECQKKQLFYNAITSAGERAANEEYHVINNNCINNMLELLNSVLPFYQRFNHWLVHKIIFNPLFCSPAFNEYIFRAHFLVKEKLPAFKVSY
jgi:hypothetical protein